MTPTATGCERRHHSATNATDAEREVDGDQRVPLWSAQVATRTSALRPGRDARTSRGRRPSRAPSAAVDAAAQLARQQHPLPARQRRASWLARSSSVSTAYARLRAPTPDQSRREHRPPAVVGERPATPILAGHDRLRRPHEALGGRTVVSDVSFRCEPGHRDRLPRTQRRRQDDDDAHARAGSPTPDAGRRDRARRPATATLPNPGRRVGVLLDAARPARRPPRARGAGRRPRRRSGVDARARRRAARRSSASTARRPASACASTRSACASGSGSPTRCSATPRC